MNNSLILKDEFKGTEYKYLSKLKGNQFVWIPVEKAVVESFEDAEKLVDEGKNPIAIKEGENYKALSYVFDSHQIKYLVVNQSEYNAEPYIVRGSIYGDSEDYIEGSTGELYQKSFNKMVEQVEKNKGFYYARYEASKGSDGKAKSKANQNAWTGITQLEASSKSRSMYTTNNGVRTDLINSYAWSTALEYINKMGSSDYINKKNTVTSILKTGQSGDKACNIYDMSGNISEWTTETATNSTGKCTYIGGGIGQQQGTAFSRYVSDTVSKSNSISFRVIMYIDN